MRLILLSLHYLYSLYAIVVWLILFPLHFLFCLLFMWFFKDRAYAAFRFSRPFVKIGFFLTGVRLNYSHHHAIPLTGPILCVSNHQSLFDIIILILVMPRMLIFISKEEVLKAPILGWDFRLQGHLTINRLDARKAIKDLENIKEQLGFGRAVHMFPEGTRTDDGSLLPFKKGPFKLAVETGTTILPLYIENSYKLLNKRSFLFLPGKVSVKIGTPIPVQKESSSLEKRKKIASLLDQTWNAIETLRS